MLSFNPDSTSTFRFPFVVKALPQMEHTNGFSPVCVRSWICRALADEKFFPQTLQLCCFGIRRGGAGPSREVIPGLPTDAYAGGMWTLNGGCCPSAGLFGRLFISVFIRPDEGLVTRLGML